ncbi:MAG: outer membrane protein assembly factor BamC, partial [Pseudomonadota bacterium]
PSLDVPPDLTQLSRDTRYAVPGGAVTASSFQLGQASQTAPTAVSSIGDVHIERSGTQRWLVIDRPADKLWEPVRDFWQENGFLLTMDQASLGIMETDWAENRAKLPQDFIRNAIGKVLDSLYSTGERDKFRTRLERNAAGGTDIFISHRGMIEVYSSTQKDNTVWQPRAVDPELEAEFLRRLMVKLGVTQEQSKAVLAAGAVKNTSRIIDVNGQPAVQINDGFDRAWRRVGLSLDRTSFTVEDRDRTKGIYFVRYVAPVADKAEAGFFGKLFGSAKTDTAPLRYRIAVVSQEALTTVSVQSANGAPDNSENAQRIVKVIADDLK